MAPGRHLPGRAGAGRRAWCANAWRRKAGIGAGTPIWLTENGVPTGGRSEAQQAAALRELVQAVHDYSGTYGIADYRWFNLRDSTSSPPATLLGATFSSDGLLRADYSAKPAFATYRSLIGTLGARTPAQAPRRRGRHRG